MLLGNQRDILKFDIDIIGAVQFCDNSNKEKFSLSTFCGKEGGGSEKSFFALRNK